jgi:hypothetical protein
MSGWDCCHALFAEYQWLVHLLSIEPPRRDHTPDD